MSKIINKEETVDVFSIFHDGLIENWLEINNGLELKISCQYLAELLNENYEYFYVRLFNIEQLFFEAWYKQNKETQIISKKNNLYDLHLEIMSGKFEENLIQVVCNTRDFPESFTGGILKFECEYIKIFDEQKNQLSIDILDTLCKTYWRNG